MNSSLFCDVEACESYAWPVGTFGHCNVTTGVCECPPGFGGSYILSDSNDCHVSDAFKQTMNSVTFGVAVFAAVSAVVALAKVSLEIYLSCRPNVVPASSQSLQRESFMVRRFRPHKIVLARKLLMRRTLFGYVFHGLIEIYRASVLVNDTHVFVTEIPAQEALIYGLSLCASTTSVFAFLYIYFTSLPKGGQMAAVLGISHDTERYQRSKWPTCARYTADPCGILLVLNWTFKYNTLLCNLLLAGVNIGYAASSSAWFVKNFMTLQMACQTFVVVDLLIVSCFLYHMNVPVYKKVGLSPDLLSEIAILTLTQWCLFF